MPAAEKHERTLPGAVRKYDIRKKDCTLRHSQQKIGLVEGFGVVHSNPGGPEYILQKGELRMKRTQDHTIDIQINRLSVGSGLIRHEASIHTSY